MLNSLLLVGEDLRQILVYQAINSIVIFKKLCSSCIFREALGKLIERFMCEAGIVSCAEYKELLTFVAALALQTMCFHGQVLSLWRVCGVWCAQGC